LGDPIFHLDLRVERCRARFALNDLPFGELVARTRQPECFAPPMNPYLAGMANIIEVEVWPSTTPDGAPIDLSEAVVELAVVRVEKGDPVAPGEGHRVATFEVRPELLARIREAEEEDEALEHPQAFFFIWDNDEGPNFAPELRDEAAFDDEGALRDYAILLRDLVRAGDVDGLVAEMEPKVQAYATAYADEAPRVRASLAEVLRDRILPAGPTTAFERDEVQLESLINGRMWALRKPDGRPLVSTEPDGEGGTYQIPIVVGLRDGGLKVVR
jgi:hypothetical protein